MPFPTALPICDPHFHVWDNVANPKNLNLGPIADGPLGVYLSATYLAAARGLPIVAAVHVETVVGQRAGGFPIDTVAETAFVLRDCVPAFGPARALGVSAYVHLGREDAPAVLARHLEAAQERLVGVRMIQNFSATDATLTWPQVESNDCLAGRVPAFGDNLRLLAALGLVFELHANPAQLGDAAALLAGLGARMPAVVINHLGCPKLGSGDEAKDAAEVAAWRAGIAALAALGPRVCIKISGLEYIYGGWLAKGSKAREVVRGLVFFVLDTFGPGRCMVASNFPVDLAMGGKVRRSAWVCGGPRVGEGGWREESLTHAHSHTHPARAGH
jgi:predicted TIM-barrel fold metal-dependent hydrolase